MIDNAYHDMPFEFFHEWEDPLAISELPVHDQLL